MLLTICPQCSAQFKVAPEQLNVRQGRVMCGRCRHVFNAFESLKRIPDEDAPDAMKEAETTPSIVVAAAPPIAPLTDVASNEMPVDHEADQLTSPPDSTDDLPTSLPDLQVSPVRYATNAGTDMRDMRNIGTAGETGNTARADKFIKAEAIDLAHTSTAGMPTVEVPLAPIAPPNATPLAIENEPDLTGSAPDSTKGAASINPPTKHPSGPETEFTSFTAATADSAINELQVSLSPSPATNANLVAAVEDSNENNFEAISANANFAPASSNNPLIHGNLRGKARTWRGWPWLASLALICLSAQTIYLFRSQIVMQYPQLRPQFVLMCNYIGCQMPWGRNQDAIKIETSDLIEPPGKSGRILLTATMANRADAKHDFPLLEVRLKDASNSLITSRIFTPSQYLARTPASGEGIAPGAEIYINLQLTLDAKTRASGYDLRAFYP